MNAGDLTIINGLISLFSSNNKENMYQKVTDITQQDDLLKQDLLKFRFSNYDFHRDLNYINRVLCVKNNT